VQNGTPRYRAVADDEPVEVPPEPRFEEPVEAIRARAQVLLLRCRVPKGLQNPHPLIAALVSEDETRRRETESRGFAWQQPRFDSRPGQRRLRIVNALFTVMEHAGCYASVCSKELDRIGFRVGDTLVAVEIAVPRKKGRAGSGDRTAPDDGITLTAAPWPRVSGVPTAWSDSASGPLETWIPEIACDLLVTGELADRESVQQQYGWRLERWQKREADIREAPERTEREERERCLRQETERREWLLGRAADRRHADDIRALVRAADARYQGAPDAAAAGVYRSWRSWALRQADLLDPCLGPLDALVGPAGPGGPGGAGEIVQDRL
jgi:hypothetical protein